MRRAFPVTLKFATARKRRAICALLQAYRAAINFYIAALWENPGKLNAETLARLSDTRLSERYKSQALKQALEIVVSTKRSAKALGKRVSTPTFKGSATLDAKFVSVEAGRGIFDLVVRLSCLASGHRLTLPTKRTKPLNKWLSVPGAKLVQGASLSENQLVLWVDIPEQATKSQGKVLGIDIGVNKLVSDSDGNHYGTDFKSVRDKIRRRKPRSKARYQAFKERDNLINRSLNQLPWTDLMVVGVERLHDMKRGKRKGRGKTFRKAIAPWTYRQVLTRIEHKAQENRVRLVEVDPANTSRTCPTCSAARKENRRGEHFKCLSCGYMADADTVGALNVLARTLETLGSVESPRLTKAVV